MAINHKGVYRDNIMNAYPDYLMSSRNTIADARWQTNDYLRNNDFIQYLEIKDEGFKF